MCMNETFINKFSNLSVLVPQSFQSSYWYSAGFMNTSEYTIMRVKLVLCMINIG